MQNIVVEKPYRFVPPYPGKIWTLLLRRYLRRYLRRTWGLVATEIRDIEHLQDSIHRGHGIVLAPNHCRPGDPLVLGQLNEKSGRPIHTMASWHLFTEGRLKAWVMRRIGAFSIYREGLDREALRAAIHIVVEAKRPLVIFPEGIVSRTNDRLGTLQEGVTFVARAAAKQRAKATPPGQVVIHPVALKYFFEGDLAASVTPVLEAIETRLSWRPERHLPLFERICRIGEGLLSLKEIEYLGHAQSGMIEERLSSLIDHLLQPLEKEWLNGQTEAAVIERIKRLRSAIVPDLVARKVSEEERGRRWRQLADIYLVQQLSCYPGDYLSAKASPERFLETVERFEEDLTDTARVYGPMRVVIQVGPALAVAPGRDKSGPNDPLLQELKQRLQAMLQGLANEPRKNLEN